MILKTSETTGKNKHHHIIFIDSDGIGITSEDKGHRHGVLVDRDPQTGAPILDRDGNLQFVVQPSDDHSHTAEELTLNTKSERVLSDEEVLEEAVQLHLEAYENEKSFLAQADHANAFAYMEQWDPQLKASLDKQKRASLVINEILPKINLLSGYERETRTEPTSVPIDGGDDRTSEIYSRAMKHVLSQSMSQYELSSVCEDQMLVGRGNIHVYVDYDLSIDGDLRVERYNYGDTLYGPHEKLDGSDCEYIVKRKWFPVRKVKAQNPDKAKELDDLETLSGGGPAPTTREFTSEITNSSLERLHGFGELRDSKTKLVRVVEVMQKEYHNTPVLFNPQQEFTLDATGMSDSDIKRCLTIPGFFRRDKASFTVYSTKYCGSVLLDHSESIFNDIPMVPVYAMKRGSKILGLVDLTMDIQDQANKLHSQMVDIINRTASYGHIHERGAFSLEQKKKFNGSVGTPGFNLEVTDMGKIRQLEGIKFPAELAKLHEVSSQKMSEVLGLSANSIDSQASSAVARQTQQKLVLVANAYLFDNNSMSRRRMAKIILDAITKIYSPKRVARMINDQRVQKAVEVAKATNAPEDIKTAQAMLADPKYGPYFSVEEIAKIWLNPNLSRYDIEIADNKHSVTFKESQFQQWAELLPNSGYDPSVWMPFLLSLSDVPGKDQFLKAIESASQQNQQGKMDESMAEIEKSKPDAQKLMEAGIDPNAIKKPRV